MSKISTEACVARLVAEMPGTKPSEWKRRSKSNRGDSVLRIFENTSTKGLWEVYEKDGSISGIQVHNPDAEEVSAIYYVLAKADMGDSPQIVLYVTDAKEFDQNGYQSDQTPKGTIKELKRLGYNGSECMESVIELTPGKSPKTYDLAKINEWAGTIHKDTLVDVEELKAKMASSKVFKFSQKFQEFLLLGDCEDFEIIPM